MGWRWGWALALRACQARHAVLQPRTRRLAGLAGGGSCRCNDPPVRPAHVAGDLHRRAGREHFRTKPDRRSDQRDRQHARRRGRRLDHKPSGQSAQRRLHHGPRARRRSGGIVGGADRHHPWSQRYIRLREFDRRGTRRRLVHMVGGGCARHTDRRAGPVRVAWALRQQPRFARHRAANCCPGAVDRGGAVGEPRGRQHGGRVFPAFPIVILAGHWFSGCAAPPGAWSRSPSR